VLEKKEQPFKTIRMNVLLFAFVVLNETSFYLRRTLPTSLGGSRNSIEKKSGKQRFGRVWFGKKSFDFSKAIHEELYGG
jgi:hypothetical protein